MVDELLKILAPQLARQKERMIWMKKYEKKRKRMCKAKELWELKQLFSR